DWEFASAHADEWEKQYAGNPAVLAALGRKYTDLKRYADAERCLKACLRLSPDRVGYVMLANNYKAQGDLDRWQQTLDTFLKTEDIGLTHAQVRVEIARHFMKAKQFDKAKPYADLAAET